MWKYFQDEVTPFLIIFICKIITRPIEQIKLLNNVDFQKHKKNP